MKAVGLSLVLCSGMLAVLTAGQQPKPPQKPPARPAAPKPAPTAPAAKPAGGGGKLVPVLLVLNSVLLAGVLGVALDRLGNVLLLDEDDLADGEGLEELRLVLHRGDDELDVCRGRHSGAGN